jgi:NAD(P)-dependent dehydrogenase (short-subunit alcohol dehydrogenase family)
MSHPPTIPQKGIRPKFVRSKLQLQFARIMQTAYLNDNSVADLNFE